MWQGLWQVYRIAMRGLAVCGFVFGAVFSPEIWMAGKVVALAGQGAIAEYRLRSIPPERYATEIEAALAAGDVDLARSLVDLGGAAEGRRCPTPLLVAVAAEPAFDLGAAAREAGTCIFEGDFNSEAGFACVIATDLTGIGDVRDLVTEGGALVLGQPYDALTLGLATVGLTLTGATVVSMGMAAPLRAGASFLKAMNKTRKLPPKLADELGRTIGNTIDGDAVGGRGDARRERPVRRGGGAARPRAEAAEHQSAHRPRRRFRRDLSGGRRAGDEGEPRRSPTRPPMPGASRRPRRSTARATAAR